LVRDSFRSTAKQDYVHVGIQHLFLPDPARYLTDRLVSVQISAPPVERILKISSKELFPALEELFPLDVFSISIIPAALRSFIHHFYPAYWSPFIDFAQKDGI